MNGQQSPPDPPKVPEKSYVSYTHWITYRSMARLVGYMGYQASRGVKELHLLLSSRGGDVGAALAAYNTMRSFPSKLFTYNTGAVLSCTNILFLAGEERLAAPHTNFLFHSAGQDFQKSERMDIPLLEEKLMEGRADNLKMAGIVRDRCAFKTPEEVTALFRGVNIFTPDEAVAVGLAHRIDGPKMPLGAEFWVQQDEEKV